jgi:hypothetical protein
MAKEKKEFNIPKEILDKVLFLDCRAPEGSYKLKKAVSKLPMIKDKETDLTTDGLEVIIKKIEVKFAIHLSYIMRSVVDCEDHYSGMVKHNTGTWLKTIYGKTIWEVLAKTLFFMYYYVESERKKAKNRAKKG